MAQNNSLMGEKRTLKDLAETHQAPAGVSTDSQQTSTDPAIAAQLADANALSATQSLIAQIGEMMDAKMLEQSKHTRKEIHDAVEIALKRQIELAEKEDERMDEGQTDDELPEDQLLYPRDVNAQKNPEDPSASNKPMDLSARSKLRVDVSATGSNADASAASKNADSELQLLLGDEDGELPQIDPEMNNENQAFLDELQNEMSSAEDKGDPINGNYIEIIKGHYMAKSSLSIEITKAMQASHIPSNCDFLRTPKINPELHASARFANNQDFVLSNEKSLYNSSNIIHHLIGSLCKIVNASMDAIPQKGGQSKALNPREIAKDALNGITLAGAVAADLAQKRRNNVRKICANDFKSLCGPKPGSLEGKKKPTNKGEEFLLGDNLKEASKEAKRGADICKSSFYENKAKGGHSNKSQGFRYSSQNNYKPKAHQFHKKQHHHQDKPYNRSYNQQGQSSFRNPNDYQNRQHQNQSNQSNQSRYNNRR